MSHAAGHSLSGDCSTIVFCFLVVGEGGVSSVCFVSSAIVFRINALEIGEMRNDENDSTFYQPTHGSWIFESHTASDLSYSLPHLLNLVSIE